MPRILLVEDEEVNRDLFRRRLERKGYAVVPTDNGLSAVALAQSEKPDLVLMDLGLPDLDGWEAMRRIKSAPATAAVPIIVLSAHTTKEARDKAFAAGGEEFETKPVDWDALFKKIEVALTRAKARAAAPPPAPASDEVDFGAAPPPDAGAPTDVIRGPRLAVPDTATLPAPPALAPTEGDKDVCAVQPKRILVVEDNDANRVMLCRRLNKHGYMTVEAADGREAIEALGQRLFDLVLCDIMMPGVDGYAVLRHLKADAELARIPIIMISAVDEMDSIVRCIEMGAEDYLQKPYEPVLLYARVNACLDKRRLRDQELAYRQAVADLTRAAEMLERGEYDPRLLAVVADRDDALGTLARVFANMVYQVQAREQHLRDEVQRLTAEEAGREPAPAPPDVGAETILLPKPPKK